MALKPNYLYNNTLDNMKINRRDPRQLSTLALSVITSGFAVVVHWLMRPNQNKKTIIFYGHTLNGNLKAFFDFLEREKEYRVFFLVLDDKYRSKLIGSGFPVGKLLYALSIKDMYRVGHANAFITSHGLHFFSIIRRFSNIKFFDVWHGIPYKGFDVDDLRHLHRHTQTWVSSPFMKTMYIEKFGFSPSRIRVTGYGRVDQLIDGTLNKDHIRTKYKIKKAKQYILVAPTWAQDDSGRSILPFGTEERRFFGELDKVAKKHGALIIFRTHLNSNESIDVGNLDNTVFMPYAEYENAEEFLYISDILVTDWSSIAFDFLPLDKPTIFMDVKAPFKKGFSLGPEYRFGDIAPNLEKLIWFIDQNLANPGSYNDRHKESIAKAKLAAYGSTLDGGSCRRYEKEMNEVL